MAFKGYYYVTILLQSKNKQEIKVKYQSLDIKNEYRYFQKVESFYYNHYGTTFPEMKVAVLSCIKISKVSFDEYIKAFWGDTDIDCSKFCITDKEERKT